MSFLDDISKTITGANNTATKAGWSDLVSAGINANKPVGGITASPVLNNNYNIEIPTPEQVKESAATSYTATIGVSNAQPKKDNTLLYVGIAVGVVVLIVVAYFFLKKK